MDKKAGLYLDFHTIDLAHLKTLVAEKKIDTALVEALIAYWKKRLDDKKDAIYSRYIEYYLFFESLKALFFAVFIFDMKTAGTRHSYGIFPALAPAIFSTVAGGEKNTAGLMDFDYNGQQYALHYLHSGYHEQDYTIAALALKEMPIGDNLMRLKYVFERYYLPSSFSRDNRIGLLFPEAQNLIAEMVNPALAQKQPVTFSYLYFESLTKYVSQAGESFARELLEELKRDVHRILKDTDRSIILSTREILIVSVNCEQEIMKKRFAGAYFHAKSLLLAFQIHFHTISTPVTDLYALWSDITNDIAYKKKAG
ncbi:MAG: hypothetical protein J0L53_03490 [Spirochaetes bacterium]|nr:hypothetical protein [Spirochaetota bacterium]MBX3720564.1 hypothetical protein [Turneriella sp.]